MKRIAGPFERRTPFRTGPFSPVDSVLELDPDAEAFIAALSTPPPVQYQIVISDLIEALKGHNLWNITDNLVLPWLLPASSSDADTLRNLKNPALFICTRVNNPTRVAAGWQFNGTTNYIRTGFAPQTSGSNFQPNSASFMVWVFASASTAASATKRHGAGDNLQANACAIQPRFSGSEMRSQINKATQISMSPSTQSDRLGFFVTNVSASNASQQYKNGVACGNHANLVQARTTREIYIGAYNNNAVAADFCDETVAGWGMHGSMNAARQLDFYNDIIAAKAARDLLPA